MIHVPNILNATPRLFERKTEVQSHRIDWEYLAELRLSSSAELAEVDLALSAEDFLMGQCLSHSHAYTPLAIIIE